MSQAKMRSLAVSALAWACLHALPAMGQEAPAAAPEAAAASEAAKPAAPAPSARVRPKPDATVARADLRPEAQGYQSVPGWILALSSEEMAKALEHGAGPSSLPWMTDAGQAWSGYAAAASRASAQGHGFGIGGHARALARLAAASAGDALGGLYETTGGRLFEFFFGHATAEDALEVSEARRYADFVKSKPWSKFDYASGLAELWDIGEWDEPRKGSVPRRLERLFVLTVRWGGQAVAGQVWDLATPDGAPRSPVSVAVIRRAAGAPAELAALPRGAGFAPAAIELAAKGASFESICGNSGLVMASVVIEDTAWLPRELGEPMAQQRLATRPGFKRVLVEVPVGKLDELLLWGASPDSKAQVEHVFDY